MGAFLVALFVICFDLKCFIFIFTLWFKDNNLSLNMKSLVVTNKGQEGPKFCWEYGITPTQEKLKALLRTSFASRLVSRTLCTQRNFSFFSFQRYMGSVMAERSFTRTPASLSPYNVLVQRMSNFTLIKKTENSDVYLSRNMPWMEMQDGHFEPKRADVERIQLGKIQCT